MTARRPARPIVGITLDSEAPGGYSSYPWYALRQNYTAAVLAAGGLPVALPHHPEAAADMLDAVDALVVTGGAFDVDPALYGAADTHPSVTLKGDRTRTEWALAAGAVERRLPVLGICGGEQLLAVVLGGTLIQHIPDALPGALPHEQPNPRHEPGHAVAVVPGTKLEQIVNKTELNVNSSHHQAVRDPGRARVNARAPDGVVEGIELPDHPFCLGVQWHPEFLIEAADRRLFDALVGAVAAAPP